MGCQHSTQALGVEFLRPLGGKLLVLCIYIYIIYYITLIISLRLPIKFAHQNFRHTSVISLTKQPTLKKTRTVLSNYPFELMVIFLLILCGFSYRKSSSQPTFIWGDQGHWCCRSIDVGCLGLTGDWWVRVVPVSRVPYMYRCQKPGGH